MCEHGELQYVELKIARDSGKKVIPVDSCIAKEIQKLVNEGIHTLSSCCGHGDEHPHVLIHSDSADKARLLGYSPTPYLYAEGKQYDVWEMKLRFKWVYWCNECSWVERMDEHKHDFCPECGHINIGRMPTEHDKVRKT